MSNDERRARRDIRRGQLLVSRLRGLAEDDAMAVLRAHAEMTGMSLHAVALAVLSECPTANRGGGHGAGSTDSGSAVITRRERDPR